MKLCILPFLIFPFFFACGEEEDCCVIPCGPEIEFVTDVEAPESGSFALLDATVEGRCLSVQIGSTGCSADRWTLRLLTEGEVLESSPTQTSGRLVFDVPVMDLTCEAYLTKWYAFDLTPYLGSGSLPSYFSLGGPVDTVLLIR